MKEISVLFVDDERNILDGLRRQFYPMNKVWEMGFVDSGEKAIEYLKTHFVDVLITDMRMPGIDGLQLLKYTYQHYPQTVRLILSGHADRNVIMQTVGLAHQYFSKPCNSDDLKNTIYQIITVKKILSEPNILKIVTQMRSIPCLPSVYNRILEVLKTDEAGIKEVADLIAKDIGLTTKILQLVNSSFFAISKKITDIFQAINLLGLDTIKDLIVTIHLFEQVDRTVMSKLHLRELWTHSLATAAINKWLAKELNLSDEDKEHAFIVGLLHDAGKLILANEFPIQYEELVKKVKDEHVPLGKLEKEVFHITHDELISYLASIWGFPSQIVHALLFYHHPCDSGYNKISLLTSLHISDYLHRKITSDELKELMHFVNINEPKLDSEYIKNLKLEDKIDNWLSYVQHNLVRKESQCSIKRKSCL